MLVMKATCLASGENVGAPAKTIFPSIVTFRSRSSAGAACREAAKSASARKARVMAAILSRATGR